MNIKVVAIAVLFTCLSSCTNDEITLKKISIDFQINALMNNKPLVLNTKNYTNASGNQFNVGEFKFYLSNLKLRNSKTGEVYEESESYHLVHPTGVNMNDKFTLQNVPVHTYDEMVFYIGIDSVRNKSIDAIGDLDPNNNMAWNWNTGYKFLMLEGDMFSAEGKKRGLILHIGSNPNYKKIVLKASPMQFKNSTATINIDAELMKLFDGKHTIDLSHQSTIMFGEVAGKIAENYERLFTVNTIIF